MGSTSVAPSPSQANEMRSESAALIAATVSSLTGIWQASSWLAMTQAVEPYLISLGSEPAHSKLSRQPLRHGPPQRHLMPQRGAGSCLAGHRRQEGLAQLLATNTFGLERVTGRPMWWDAKIALWYGCQAVQPRMRCIETVDSQL
jgi:hypothetical protein